MSQNPVEGVGGVADAQDKAEALREVQPGVVTYYDDGSALGIGDGEATPSNFTATALSHWGRQTENETLERAAQDPGVLSKVAAGMLQMKLNAPIAKQDPDEALEEGREFNMSLKEAITMIMSNPDALKALRDGAAGATTAGAMDSTAGHKKATGMVATQAYTLPIND